MQEIVSKNETITVDTRVHTAIKIEGCKHDITVIDKRLKLITIIDFGITSQNRLESRDRKDAQILKF